MSILRQLRVFNLPRIDIKSIIAIFRELRSDFDFSKWEMLYQCRAVTSLMSRENAIDTLLNCARAARRSSEFHPASRFLRQGGNKLYISRL